MRRFDVSNGLPQSSVLDLATDSLGFLWITTEGGLVRFDGNRFKLVQPKDFPNATQRMREFVRTSAGTLFITDARGNLLMEHGHNTALHVASGPRFIMHGTVPDHTHVLGQIDTSSALFKAIGPSGRMVLYFGNGRWGAVTTDSYYHLHGTTVVSTWPVDFSFNHCWRLEDRLIAVSREGEFLSIDPVNGSRQELHRAGQWPMAPKQRMAKKRPANRFAGRSKGSVQAT